MSQKNVSNFIDDVIYQEAIKRGFSDLRFLKNWDTIVGEEFCNAFKPTKILKLLHNREKGSVLFVFSNIKKDRHTFQFIKEEMKNRINLFFGANFIIDIRLDNLDY